MQQMQNMSNMQAARLGPGSTGQQMTGAGLGNMQQGVSQMAPSGGMVGGQMGMGTMSGGGPVGQGPNSGQMGGGMQMGGGGLAVGNAQMANQPMGNMNNMGMIAINSGMAPNQSINVSCNFISFQSTHTIYFETKLSQIIDAKYLKIAYQYEYTDSEYRLYVRKVSNI